MPFWQNYTSRLNQKLWLNGSNCWLVRFDRIEWAKDCASVAKACYSAQVMKTQMATGKSTSRRLSTSSTLDTHCLDLFGDYFEALLPLAKTAVDSTVTGSLSVFLLEVECSVKGLTCLQSLLAKWLVTGARQRLSQSSSILMHYAPSPAIWLSSYLLELAWHWILPAGDVTNLARLMPESLLGETFGLRLFKLVFRGDEQLLSLSPKPLTIFSREQSPCCESLKVTTCLLLVLGCILKADSALVLKLSTSADWVISWLLFWVAIYRVR